MLHIKHCVCDHHQALKDYKLAGHVATAGPGGCWRVFSAVNKKPGAWVSMCVGGGGGGFKVVCCQRKNAGWVVGGGCWSCSSG